MGNFFNRIKDTLDSVLESFSSSEEYDSDVESGDLHLKKRLFLTVRHFIEKHLGIIMLVAVFSGGTIGILCRLRPREYTNREVMYAGFLGSLYIRMLQCATFPLFTTSIVTAFGNMDWKSSGKISFRILLFFVSSMVIAQLFSACLMFTFKPGTYLRPFSSIAEAYIEFVTTWNYVYDVIRNLIPANIIEACMFMYKTELRPPKYYEEMESFQLEPVDVPVRATNYLGLIVVAMALGISLSYMGSAVRVCLSVAEALNQLCIDITFLALHLSPPGMFCLALSQMLAVKDLSLVFFEMGLAVALVMICQIVYIVVLLPALYFLLTRKNVYKLYYHLFPVAATAWSTSASIASIPVTLKVLEKRLGLSRFTARLIVPLGANLHHPGGAVSQIVLPWYIAQNLRIHITVGEYIVAGLVAFLTSMVTAGVPGGTLNGMQITTSYLGVLSEETNFRAFMVDFIVDRCDTLVNVVGDCVAAAYLEHKSKKELRTVNPSRSILV